MRKDITANNGKTIYLDFGDHRRRMPRLQRRGVLHHLVNSRRFRVSTIALDPILATKNSSEFVISPRRIIHLQGINLRIHTTLRTKGNQIRTRRSLPAMAVGRRDIMPMILHVLSTENKSQERSCTTLWMTILQIIHLQIQHQAKSLLIGISYRC